MAHKTATQQQTVDVQQEVISRLQAKGGSNVSWKWLAGGLIGLLTISTGALATNLNQRVSETEKKVNEQQSDIAVIKTQIQQIQRDTQETRDTTKDTNKKLDDLREFLRRR